jgi:hypothetical protein
VHWTLISYPNVSFVAGQPICMVQEQYQRRRGTILRSKPWHPRNRLQPHQRHLNRCFHHPSTLPSIPRRLFEDEHIDPVSTIFPFSSEFSSRQSPIPSRNSPRAPPSNRLPSPSPTIVPIQLQFTQTFSKNSPPQFPPQKNKSFAMAQPGYFCTVMRAQSGYFCTV